jgi:transposase
MAAILGLDISKETIDACLLSDGAELAQKVSNNAKGFAQLKKWLENRRVKDVHVCMEATGSYFEAVAEYFADRAFTVSVVNPAQIKAYSQSLLLRAKTDAVDAMAIAKFCAAQQPQAWIPPTPKERELRGLVRLCANLKDTRASYDVQRQRPNIVETVERSIEEVLAGLDDQIEKVEEEIAKLIDDDPDLRNRRNLLTSIDGIGDTTAATILAEAPRLEEFRDAKAVAAFAGLSSQTRSSGTSVRGSGKICKTGNARLRKALWWPAIAAMRYNKRLSVFAERLSAAGKPKKKIIVATMRRLLVLAYGVLKSRKPYQAALTEAS